MNAAAKKPSEHLDEAAMGVMEQSPVSAPATTGIPGLSGKVIELGIGCLHKMLPPETISIFTVAEQQTAHFKAKIVFRLTSPATEVEDMKLEVPSANLIVYYVQLIIGDLSVFRIGIQDETEENLVYTFGKHFVRSSVQVIIRGSFKYLENPGVGLVTLLFPNLVGSNQKNSPALGHIDRRAGDEVYSRDLRLDVHCLLALPAPFHRIVGGQSIRSVSPDGNRIFVRHTEGRNIWDSVELCVMCRAKNPECPTIILHHPKRFVE